MTRKTLPGNNVISYYSYDVAARLRQLENRRANLSLISYFAYARNANGTIERQTRAGNLNTYYTYDELERLTAEEWKNGATPVYGFLYSYDAASNRATKTDAGAVRADYYFDNRNLLTKDYALQPNTTDYYTYDGAQRMTRKYSSSEAFYFSYNQRNMITGIVDQKAAGADKPRYFTYNGVGERVLVVDSNVATPPTLYWAYDGPTKLLQEKDTSGSVARTYRHNESQQDKLGSILEYKEPALFVTAYPDFDQRGTINNMADTYVTDAFGVLLGEIATTGNREIFATPAGLADLDTSDIEVYLGPFGEAYLVEEGRVLVGPALAVGDPDGSHLFIPLDDDEEGEIAPDADARQQFDAEHTSTIGDPLTDALVEAYKKTKGFRDSLDPRRMPSIPVRTQIVPWHVHGPLLPGQVWGPAPPSGCCGPEVTDGFLESLRRTLKFMAGMGMMGRPSPRNVAKMLPATAYKGQVYQLDHCPTLPDCADTVTICGLCINKSELRNLAFGFAVRRMGYTDWSYVTSAVGLVKAAQGKDFSNADRMGMTAGLQLGGGGTANDVPTTDQLCRTLRGQYSSIQSDAPSGCRPCDLRLPPDKFPFLLDGNGSPVNPLWPRWMKYMDAIFDVFEHPMGFPMIYQG